MSLTSVYPVTQFKPQYLDLRKIVPSIKYRSGAGVGTVAGKPKQSKLITKLQENYTNSLISQHQPLQNQRPPKNENDESPEDGSSGSGSSGSSGSGSASSRSDYIDTSSSGSVTTSSGGQTSTESSRSFDSISDGYSGVGRLFDEHPGLVHQMVPGSEPSYQSSNRSHGTYHTASQGGSLPSSRVQSNQTVNNPGPRRGPPSDYEGHPGFPLPSFPSSSNMSVDTRQPSDYGADFPLPPFPASSNTSAQPSVVSSDSSMASQYSDEPFIPFEYERNPPEEAREREPEYRAVYNPQINDYPRAISDAPSVVSHYSVPVGRAPIAGPLVYRPGAERQPQVLGVRSLASSGSSRGDAQRVRIHENERQLPGPPQAPLIPAIRRRDSDASRGDAQRVRVHGPAPQPPGSPQAPLIPAVRRRGSDASSRGDARRVRLQPPIAPPPAAFPGARRGRRVAPPAVGNMNQQQAPLGRRQAAIAADVRNAITGHTLRNTSRNGDMVSGRSSTNGSNVSGLS